MTFLNLAVTSCDFMGSTFALTNLNNVLTFKIRNYEIKNFFNRSYNRNDKHVFKCISSEHERKIQYRKTSTSTD